MEKCEEIPKYFVTVEDSVAVALARLKEENANLLFKLSEILEHIKCFPTRSELKYGNYTLVDRCELNSWLERLQELSKK